jgi:hypothetical protein
VIETVREEIQDSLFVFHSDQPVQVNVKSVEPSIKFWTERFEFRKTIEVPEGDHIGFVALDNDAVEVMYQTYSGMQADPSNPLAKAVDQGTQLLVYGSAGHQRNRCGAKRG